ncbi:thiosulfate oxidation carrier protein SoxY [Thiorhodovibrio frisius]|uniref:Putative secreted protein n=1 Tax=Thiorhodovibrio frisius TaxID=631362 RepID=H8Z1K5_9GAMM|nr:thiosulfate oxidation carrier protein SoxY [Thiorhodovibrio frisius]EIC21450.1 putative secreted protein [Thiorhodovibrio frisius]WPL24036.1 sulfur oxidation protein SoxY [Thiorhodovibrio frisius]
MIDNKRRTLLKASVGAGALGLAAGAGLLIPQALLAAWPKAAFEAKDKDAALKDLLGSDTFETSDAVKIDAPPAADNSALVRLTVSTDLEDAKSITIFAAGNQRPLIASFELSEYSVPYVSMNIKMAETADVIAVVQTPAGLFGAAKNVKVTAGGCGA